ncbi:MAG: right-handed parallel beta-helix repeat-containing protein [Myxococcales bacterium]|nr:right-handed parallel beta-helix repeat-containing protein [Myxococcales bacterium]
MRHLLLAMVSLGWFAFAAATTASCKKENAAYCSPDEPASAEQHPLNRCAADEVCLVGIANSCLPKAACDDGSLCGGTSGTPFCAANADTRSATCEAACTADVQCAALSADLPMCAGGDCVQCIAGADCASTLCNTDNTCVDAAEVAYAAHNGSGNTCTLATPCDFATALTKVSATVKYIKLAASSSSHYQAPFVISDLDVTIIGDLNADGIPTARFVDINISDDQPLLKINGTGYDVRFVNVSIEEGNNSSAADAVNLECSGTGTVSIIGSRVIDSEGVGVRSGSSCTLVVEGSTIARNNLGGLDISGPFSITNNFIAFNGDENASAVGGTSIAVAGSPTSSIFSHNSVVSNESNLGAGGVVCTINQATVLSNNIIALNDSTFGQLSLASQCTASNTASDDSLGTNPVVVSVFPFVNAASSARFDLHLTADLPSQGTPIAAITTDIDGDTRSTTAPDIGADER